MLHFNFHQRKCKTWWNEFFVHCIHVLHYCADPKKLPADHNSIFKCFTFKKKTKPNSLVRLELTTSYSTEILRDYERRIVKEESKVLLSRQRQTPELEWVY